jgi:AcrR family transcriptional regulator
MADPVKGRRRYDASGRHRQVQQSRARMLAAAQDLFLADGYSATTIPRVAREAGVSAQSVYKAFGNKGGLVKAVFDTAIAGDDQPVSMIEREALLRVRNEPDPVVKLWLYAAFVADTAPRHVPVQLLLRSAAAADAEAALVWQQLCTERLTGMSMFAQALGPHLRDDIDIDDARDLLWTYNSPELWDLLVLQRRWSPDRYADELARTLIHALLP